MTLEAQPTQVVVKNKKVIEFFNSQFVGSMKKHFEDFDFVSVILFKRNEESPKDRIAFYHKRAKPDEPMTVDAENPEDLKKLLKVLEEFDGCE